MVDYNVTQASQNFLQQFCGAVVFQHQWRTENPPPEIPKALQNRAKLDPIVKNVKKCWI